MVDDLTPYTIYIRDYELLDFFLVLCQIFILIKKSSTFSSVINATRCVTVSVSQIVDRRFVHSIQC